MAKHYRLKATQFLACNYSSMREAAMKLINQLNVGDSVTIPANHWLAEKSESVRERKCVRAEDKTFVIVRPKITSSCSAIKCEGKTDRVISTMTMPNGDVRLERIAEQPHRMNWVKYLAAFSQDGRVGSAKVTAEDMEYFNWDISKFKYAFVNRFIPKFGHSDIHISEQGHEWWILSGRNGRENRDGAMSERVEIVFNDLMRNFGQTVDMADEAKENASFYGMMHKKANEVGVKLVTSKRFGIWKLQPN